MTEVEELVKEMNTYKEQLDQLEARLQAIQRSCDHQFSEEESYRICIKCHYMESYHY